MVTGAAGTVASPGFAGVLLEFPSRVTFSSTCSGIFSVTLIRIVEMSFSLCSRVLPPEMCCLPSHCLSHLVHQWEILRTYHFRALIFDKVPSLQPPQPVSLHFEPLCGRMKFIYLICFYNKLSYYPLIFHKPVGLG